MKIDHKEGETDKWSYLISNCLICKAAYEAVKLSPDITIMSAVELAQVSTKEKSAYIKLKNGDEIKAQLLVAADSRFPETWRAMGICTDMHDFGKTMMVCVMEHEIEHIALEWFDVGQKLALLPMNGMRSSIILTFQPLK